MTDQTIVITNPDRQHMALLQAKHRLLIELKIPGCRWQISGLECARRCGYTGPRRREKALEWVKRELLVLEAVEIAATCVREQLIRSGVGWIQLQLDVTPVEARVIGGKLYVKLEDN